MIVYKKILGFLVSFLLSLSLLIAYYSPERIIYLIIFSFLLLLFYFWSIKNRFVSYGLLIKYFLVVLVFLIFVWLFFIVINSWYAKYITSLVVFIYLAIILDSFFKKVYTNQDISRALIIYIDLVCFWLIVYFLFYALVLFRMNIYLSALMLLGAVIVLTLIRFYWLKIDFKKSMVYVLVLSVIVGEIYMITSFLALNFYSSTFMVWVWYYLLMDFFGDKIKDEFIWSKKKKLLFLVAFFFIFYLISVR